MEAVDWDWGPSDASPEHESFAETQVGSVTLALEPVATGSPLNWVADQFQSQPDLFALPVEKDGGVVGLVTRGRVLERSGKFLENLSSRPLDHDLTPHRGLDARESIDKVVASLFADDQSALVEYFVVYLDGQYFGLTDLRRLVSRSARLRDQDLQKAQDVQQTVLAQNHLPPTTWSRGRLVQMAYGVGGDVYQEASWSDGTCLVACFDVSGKGISGSLVTSALAGYFAALRAEGGAAPALNDVALRLNAFLQEFLPLGTFVTGVVFHLPSKTAPGAQLRILNFGYGPVYFYRRVEGKISGKGWKPNLPPLGLDGLSLDEGSAFMLPWEPGTKVFAFSDGMGDLMTPSGKRYGEDKVRELVTKGYPLTPKEFEALVQEEIDSWKQDAPQADDITMVVLQA